MFVCCIDIHIKHKIPHHFISYSEMDKKKGMLVDALLKMGTVQAHSILQDIGFGVPVTELALEALNGTYTELGKWVELTIDNKVCLGNIELHWYSS